MFGTAPIEHLESVLSRPYQTDKGCGRIEDDEARTIASNPTPIGLDMSLNPSVGESEGAAWDDGNGVSPSNDSVSLDSGKEHEKRD